MQGIRHRKHRSRGTPLRPFALSTLVAGIALGLPSLAAGAPAATSAADASGAPTQLPAINVKGRYNPYKIDAVQSPKLTQPLLDTPQTINVIGKDIIQQQGATTLADALRNSPGVGTFYVGENGGTSTGDAVYMRGFDASGSIFVDGVRDLGSISRDVFNTEQVEVVKGPDGTLFGRTTPTGAINMVSKQPLRDNGVSATLAYGSWNQKRSTADWNQTLGEHAAFRLNVMGQASGVPGRDHVQNDRWGIAPSLAFGLGTSTTVYLDYLHVSQDNVPDGGVPTLGLPGYASPDPARPFLTAAAKVDPSNFYGTDADHDHVKADMLTLTVHHEFSANATLTDTLRWGRTQENYLLTSFMGNTANLLTPDPLDPSTWTLARSNPTFRDQTNRVLTNQANLLTHFNTGGVEHDLSTGLELTREEVGTGGYGALDGSAWSPANLYHPDSATATGLVTGDNGTWSRGRTDTAGIYAFDTLHFGERWLLTAGGRLDHYRTNFRNVVICGRRGNPACGDLATGAPVPGMDADKQGNLVSYKLGLVYKPAANGSVYADFATASEPPGGNHLAFSASASNADNPVFSPQKARTLEVGTKWNVLDGQLRLSAALFRTVVSNLVVQDPVDLQYYQIGRERVAGIEVGAVGQITRSWAVSAGYTRLNTHADAGVTSSSTSPSAPAANGSNTLAYTPKSSFTAWSTWKLPHHLTLGAGARHSGAMQRGHDGAIGTPQSTGAYWVVDAMASYGINRHASLQLNVYNLFDKNYVAAINKSGYRYTPGAPRSALLTLNLKF
ncbi:MAG TPA: catecholate siderophore receptor Fiu [Rhodanobacteraceae bacterium]|nr:catecholate siderophore receptor Fiu [Rhodanobacteraceae bacterium]